jgi:pimeloyl-ACP methyl ester carboxylesterase
MEPTWVRKSRNGTSVVFVHGILSSIENAWLAKTGAFWPKMLCDEKSIDDVGVYLFNYRADAFSGTYSIDDAVDAMREYFRLDEVWSQEQVIFVCHSMGGIVARRFLVTQQSSIINTNRRIGLFLVASPSLGATYANFLSMVAPIYNIQLDTLRFSQTNAWLNALDRDFINLKESNKANIFGKELIEDEFIAFRRFLRRAQVVPPWSGAKYFGEPVKIPLSDHITIAKPETPKAIQHRILTEFVQTSIRAGNGESVSPAQSPVGDNPILIEWPTKPAIQVGEGEPPPGNVRGPTRRQMLTAAAVISAAAGGGAIAYKFRGPREAADILARDGAIAAISTIATISDIARFNWRGRGVAPIGYTKGMALVYARVYLKLQAGDAAAVDMAKANTGDADNDVLAYYRETFGAAGLSNAGSGGDTLRHMFVLLTGLGMWESSGKYCNGADRTAPNVTEESADAGLFQTAASLYQGVAAKSEAANAILTGLFKYYVDHPSGFADVFDEGVKCRPEDRANFGTGDGRDFQKLSKQNPAFAAEFAAVGLRHLCKHWGPIVRREVELRPECDAMLRQIQTFVEKYKIANTALE